MSTSSVVSALPGSKVKEKILGVAAALKAQGDSGFEVRPEIFDEFSLEGRVGVVSPRQTSCINPMKASRKLRKTSPDDVVSSHRSLEVMAI